MLSEALQEKAILYVSGAMEATERDNFEVLLEFRMELRALVAGLQEVTTAVAVADCRAEPRLPDDLKARIFGALESSPSRPAERDSLVVADAQGCIEWVCAGFSAMCGYTLAELRGRKPGQVLQGPGTDRAVVARISAALRGGRECRETLVNYHKLGTPYRVDVRIAGLWDDAGQPLAFVARERKLAD